MNFITKTDNYLNKVMLGIKLVGVVALVYVVTRSDEDED